MKGFNLPAMCSAAQKTEGSVGVIVGRSKRWTIFLAGILFCIVTVILPELFPAIHGRQGFDWTPVHSQNYRIGDLYYYAAWLREAVDSGFPVFSPSAKELAGQPLIETWRCLGIGLAALPGHVITDIRTLIVFDYAFSAALFFCAGYLFAFALTRNCWIALSTGVAVLFMTDRLWVPIPGHAESLAGLGKWMATSYRIAIASLKYACHPEEYDLYGSTFRFINMSFSTPILLFYYFMIILVYRQSDFKVIVPLAMFSPLMSFTYPSHAIAAYGLVTAFSNTALYRRKWRACVTFVSIGTATLLFLEVIKYRQMMSELLSRSQLWNNIFATEKLVLLSPEIGYVLAAILFNKYLLTFLAMLYLARNQPLLVDIVAATGMVVVPLSGVYLFNMPQLWGRFLGRGVDHLWFMLLVVVVGNALRRTITGLRTGDARTQTFRDVCRRTFSGMAIGMFLILFLLPGYGFTRLAVQTASDGSRFIPKETMEAYRWMGTHLTHKAEVATLDWEDITLLPIYTDLNLVVGHSVIDGRSPTEELKRFVETWKFLGYDRLQLEHLIDLGPTAVRGLFEAKISAHLPYLAETEFAASQFMMGILYWPYVHDVAGIKIVKDEKWGRISPAFRRYVLDIYDSAEPGEFIRRYKVNYVIMSAKQLMSPGSPKGVRLLHRTGTRSIFAPAS